MWSGVGGEGGEEGFENRSGITWRWSGT